MGSAESQGDRFGACELRSDSRRNPCGKRYHVSERGGSRREHGFADPEQLRGFWIWHRGTRNGVCTARSRRTFLTRSHFTECAGGKKTADAYDYPGIRAEGRNTGGVRDYGRMEPVAGPCTVRGESGGLQNEHPGGAGSTAIQQTLIQRMRRDGGEPDSPKSARGTGGKGTQD